MRSLIVSGMNLEHDVGGLVPEKMKVHDQAWCALDPFLDRFGKVRVTGAAAVSPPFTGTMTTAETRPASQGSRTVFDLVSGEYLLCILKSGLDRFLTTDGYARGAP